MTWVVAGLIKMELLKDGLHLVLSEEILFPTGRDDVLGGAPRKQERERRRSSSSSAR